MPNGFKTINNLDCCEMMVYNVVIKIMLFTRFDESYIYGKGSGNDTIYDYRGTNRIKFTDLMPEDLTAYYPTSGYDAVLIVASIGETLTIKDFRASTLYRNFVLEFADGRTGTINYDSALIELDPVIETDSTVETEHMIETDPAIETDPVIDNNDDQIQTGADILDELYSNDNPISDLLSENDDTIISEVTDSVPTADDNNDTADQIDVQVMILTENMAAFSNESNIFDSMNMQNPMDDYMLADQLLVDTQAS